MKHLTHVVRMAGPPQPRGLHSPSRAGPDPLRACLWDCALWVFPTGWFPLRPLWEKNWSQITKFCVCSLQFPNNNKYCSRPLCSQMLGIPPKLWGMPGQAVKSNWQVDEEQGCIATHFFLATIPWWMILWSLKKTIALPLAGTGFPFGSQQIAIIIHNYSLILGQRSLCAYWVPKNIPLVLELLLK